MMKIYFLKNAIRRYEITQFIRFIKGPNFSWGTRKFKCRRLTTTYWFVDEISGFLKKNAHNIFFRPSKNILLGQILWFRNLLNSLYSYTECYFINLQNIFVYANVYQKKVLETLRYLTMLKLSLLKRNPNPNYNEISLTGNHIGNQLFGNLLPKNCTNFFNIMLYFVYYSNINF